MHLPKNSDHGLNAQDYGLAGVRGTMHPQEATEHTATQILWRNFGRKPLRCDQGEVANDFGRVADAVQTCRLLSGGGGMQPIRESVRLLLERVEVPEKDLEISNEAAHKDELPELVGEGSTPAAGGVGEEAAAAVAVGEGS